MDIIDHYLDNWEKFMVNGVFSSKWIAAFPELSQHYISLYEQTASAEKTV